MVSADTIEGIILNDKIEKVAVKPFLSYYIDFAKEKDLSSVMNPDVRWLSNTEFDQALAGQLNHIRGFVWAKFRIRNQQQTKQVLLLNLNNPLFEIVDIYYQRENQVDTYKSGRARAFSERAIAHRLHLFPLTVNSQEEITVGC